MTARLNILILCLLYTTLALSRITTEKTFLSSKLTAASSIQIDHLVYFVGGFEYSDLIATDKIEVYNTINQTWEKPLKLPVARGFVSPAKSGSNIYFAGGFTYENCTQVYSTESHAYEWTIGCGPTVISSIQLSVHNEILTVLGNFSADFYDLKNKTWSHSETLTTLMQSLSHGVLFVHEDLIVGIGGIQQETLDPYSGAWVFNTTSQTLSKASNVTTLSTTNVKFNFTVNSNTIAAWLADRCILHRLGTSEWIEIMHDGAIHTATVGDETLIVNSDGFTTFDWTSRTVNWTADSNGILNAFSFSNQIVLIKNDSLAIYDGTWTYLPFPAVRLFTPSFGQYILYDGDYFYLYNPATKSTTAQTGGFRSIASIVPLDSTTFTAFASGGYRVIFENGVATRYGYEEPVMVGQFAIGRDIIDLTSGRVWINMTSTTQIQFASSAKLRTWSSDGSFIAVEPSPLAHQRIDTYNYITGQWKDPVTYSFVMTPNRFMQTAVLEEKLVLSRPATNFIYLVNMTTGNITQLGITGVPTSGNFVTFAPIPIHNNVGYYIQSSRYIFKFTIDSLTTIFSDQLSTTMLQQPYSDNTRAIYMSVYSTETATRDIFFNVLSYDYLSGSWNIFVLPKTQTRLFIAATNGLLLTFGGDGLLTYTSAFKQVSQWSSTTFKLEYNPAIISTLDDGRVLIAGGKHPTLGFSTNEVMILNVTDLLSDFYVTPDSAIPTAAPTNVSEPIGLSTGELAVAIVVPVGVVVIGSVIFAVLFVRWKKRSKRRVRSTTVGLAAKYGDWFTPFEELVFEEQLGQGGSGQVFKGKWKNTTVALKVSMTEANSTVIGELELMMQMRPHPNVVQLFGFSVHPETQSIILIIEYCDGGSLQSVLEDRSVDISLNQKSQWMQGVAQGLAHLHSHSIVHRDVAARNVLLSHNEAKLTDFGLSRLVDEQSLHGTTKSELGPIRWMSPESLKSKKYSVKSDVWAFGILMYEVLSREEPHAELDPIEVGLQIRDNVLTPVIPNDCPTQLASVMKDCWSMAPESRPSMEQIALTLANG